MEGLEIKAWLYQAFDEPLSLASEVSGIFLWLWMKPYKAPCKKSREVTYYFVIAFLTFFFPPLLGPLLRLHLLWLNQLAPDIWITLLWSTHMQQAGFTLWLPFGIWWMTFGFPYSAASEAESFSSVCCWETQRWARMRRTLSRGTLGTPVNYRDGKALQRLALILSLPHLYLASCTLSTA